MSEPGLLTVNEAAARLRCSRRKIFDLLADGTLVHGAKYGRETVILEESVTAAREMPTERKAPRVRLRKYQQESVDDVLANFRRG